MAEMRDIVAGLARAQAALMDARAEALTSARRLRVQGHDSHADATEAMLRLTVAADDHAAMVMLLRAAVERQHQVTGEKLVRAGRLLLVGVFVVAALGGAVGALLVR